MDKKNRKKISIALEKTLLKRIEIDDKFFNYIYFDRLLFPYNVEASIFRNNYKKQKGSWKGWTYAYSEDPRYEKPLEITWNYWQDYYKINIPCYQCNRIIENFGDYSPHHLSYSKKYWELLHIVPLHSWCHHKGRFSPQFLDRYWILYKGIKFLNEMEERSKIMKKSD